MEIRESVALVTGASSGIGEAVARELADRGARVALLARSRERLERVADEMRSGGGHALAVPADVTSESEIEAAVSAVREAWGPVGLLVNNAGTGLLARLDETPVEEAAALFDLNVLGMLRTLRHVVPGMRRRGHGALVHMASASAHKALPLNTVYSATKAAVARLAEGLRMELEGSGVTVHCVYPVGTETDFLEASRNHLETERSLRFFSGRFVPVQTPEEVAAAVAEGVEKGTPEIYPYRPTRLLRPLNALAPRLVERATGLTAYRDAVLPEDPEED